MPPTLAPGPTRKRQPRRPAEHGHPGGAIAITAQTRRYEWTGPLCTAQRFADGGELALNEVSSACWCRATCGPEDLTTPRAAALRPPDPRTGIW
jgi:hypothetical protein